MTEPTMSESSAASRDHAPILPDPDPRAIDLSPSVGPDRLDDGTRAWFAQAGQDALDACLSRFALTERAAFWRAICRCYNRPYNSVDILSADILPTEVPAVTVAASEPPGEVPAAHVIDAVRMAPDAVLPDIALR